MNVPRDKLMRAIQEVWFSLWSERAIAARKRAGIPGNKVYMAVVIQQMLCSDFSFVMHTVNPISGNENEIYIEIAPGQGEALTDTALMGTPYRMTGHKINRNIKMNAFASLSYGLWPHPAGGLQRKTLAYSSIDLSTQRAGREALGKRLTQIGQLVETAFQGPQDIEGAAIGNDVYLLQARPQVMG